MTLIIASVFFLSGSGFAEASTSSSGGRELKETIYAQVCEGLQGMYAKLPLTIRMPSFCRTLPPPPPPLPTVSLDANPNPITAGSSSTLEWTSSNAASCTASGGWTGSKSIAGNESVSPTTDTTYTLTCTNATGSASDSATITVNALPAVPTVSLDADPDEILEGQNSTLTWTTSGADTCNASGGWSGSRTFSGNEVVTPSATTTYTLTCNNAGGSSSDSETVAVSPLPPMPTVSLSADPSAIHSGESSTLTWVSTDADTCTASGAWSGSKTVSGNQLVSPTATSTYTLTCENEAGFASDSAEVGVMAPVPAPIVTLAADHLAITVGATTTLTWSSTNASTCAASNGWSGSRTLSGSEIISPTATTTYTLTCEGEGGSSNESVIIGVTPVSPVPTVSLNALPGLISEGATSTLTWSSSNADSCVASNGWSGSKAVSGSEIVSPVATTTYALTCTGSGGNGEASTTVNVMLLPVVTANHVVISEVYYDVDGLHGDEPAHEWIELHNPTATPVALENWSIIDTASSVDVIPSGVIIAAHGYVLLAATTTLPSFWSIQQDVPVVNLASSLGNGLGNVGDSLVLRNSATTTVDAISWGTDTSIFSPAIIDVISGHSIARNVAGVDTDATIDWIDREVPTLGF